MQVQRKPDQRREPVCVERDRVWPRREHLGGGRVQPAVRRCMLLLTLRDALLEPARIPHSHTAGCPGCLYTKSLR